jgi:hypothetical protein
MRKGNNRSNTILEAKSNSQQKRDANVITTAKHNHKAIYKLLRQTIEWCGKYTKHMHEIMKEHCKYKRILNEIYVSQNLQTK